MANRILTEFLTEMKEVLKVKKTVALPGLGRLRATRENHFFFVADEDLDIYPEGLGLTPLSLKTHVETPEEVATAVAGLAELITETEEKIPDQVVNVEEVTAAEVIPPSAALDRNDKEERLGQDDKSRKVWRWIWIVLGALVGLLLILILLSRLVPGLLDPLMYSREELQILRY